MLLYLLVKIIFYIIVVLCAAMYCTCTSKCGRFIVLGIRVCALNFSQQYTPEIHRDKYNLLKAISVMADVANAINEFKRRKDLGEDVNIA